MYMLNLLKFVVLFPLILHQLSCIHNDDNNSIGKYENSVCYFDLLYWKLLSTDRKVIPVSSLEIKSNGQLILTYCSPTPILGQWYTENGRIYMCFNSSFCGLPEYLESNSLCRLKGKSFCDQKHFLYNFKKVE